jgi:YVTN family beta-propeller protein/autotransporter-associated beta strand protein
VELGLGLAIPRLERRSGRRIACALLASTALVAAALAPQAARAQEGPFVYVPNRGTGSVSIIDSSTNTVQPGTIPVGFLPFAIGVRGDQALVYVTNQGSNNVSVVDTATNTVVATVNVGVNPIGVTVSPDGSRVYVANLVSNTVSVLDAATNTVLTTVNVGIQPVGITVSPDGSRVYVANQFSNTISVVDTATNTVVATVNVGAVPAFAAISPDGSRVYVTNAGSDNVSVIDTATNTVLTTVPVGNDPTGVTVSPDGSRVYVANRLSDSVSVLDTATNTVLTTVNAGNDTFGVTVSPDGSRVYVTNLIDNTVSVLDTATNTFIATLPVGTNPSLPGVCGNGNALLTAGNTFIAKQSGALGCTGAGGPVFTGGTMQIAAANITSALPMVLGAQGGTIDTQANTATFSGAIGGPGGLTKNGTGTLTLLGNNSYAGGTTINAGTLNLGDATNTARIVGAVTNHSLFNIVNADTSGITSIVNTNFNAVTQFFNATSAGNATITNTAGDTIFWDTSTAGNARITSGGAAGQFGETIFAGTSTAGNATIVNNNFGLAGFAQGSTAGSATITNNAGGATQFFDNSTAGSATITNTGTGLTAETGAQTIFRGSSTAGNAIIVNNAFGVTNFNFNATAGNATIVTNANGFVVLRGNSSGGTARFITNAGGEFDISFLTAAGTMAGSIEGAGAHFLGGKVLTVGGNNLSTEVSGVIADGGFNGGVGGALTKVGTGTLILSGNNSYTGATTVNGGTLLVNGFNGNSATIVNAGATLGGNGTTGPLTVNGGTVAPGNSIGTLTVNGNATFGSGVYQVEVSPAAADRINVTGTAALGGTVQAVFLPGSFRAQTYTILNATGGVTGTFSDLTVAGAPGANNPRLAYDANNVFLQVDSSLISPLLPTGTPSNPAAVAGGIDRAVLGGATPPPAFDALFNFSGAGLVNALTQLSGEVATGFQPASHLSMNMFLSAMLDPFVGGRNRGFGAAMPYASERAARRGAAQDAFAAAMPVKAAPQAPTFDQRWAVWGSAYGGRTRTDGDPAAGSSELTDSAAGFTAGADYRVSQFLTLGAAVAIGETRWNVANLGGGSSNLAQVGGYASAQWNSFYLSAALAGAWHNGETNRTIAVAGLDRLEADFDATVFGARLEGGWRYDIGRFGLIPYGAVQVQSVHTPSYAERATIGSADFALTYASQTVTDTRTELGLWADTQHNLADGSQLLLRARAAWMHDYDPESRVNAVFQTLPGSNFSVDGALSPRDAALASAAAELRLTNGISLIGRFDGEFSGLAQTYAGTGTVRYQW